MRVVWRRLGPGELDAELLWLSVSLGGVALAAAWLWAGLPWPQCMFFSLTGHPCLTCGATRAAIQFLHLNFSAALHWNPLMFFFYVGVALFDVYALIVLVTRARRLRFLNLTSAEKNVFRFALIAALLANWSYLLATW